jgi:hypothetical protein
VAPAAERGSCGLSGSVPPRPGQTRRPGAFQEVTRTPSAIRMS